MNIMTSRTRAQSRLALYAAVLASAINDERSLAPRGATKTGTMGIDDLLATENVSVIAFGLDNVQQVLQADLDAHNAILRDMVGELAETSIDRLRRYGPIAGGEMVKVDEFGRSTTQKSKGGDTVGFPLEKFQYAIGWTRDWFLMHTPADMARQQLAAEKAHVQAVLKEVKRALYLSTDYSFNDYFVDQVVLPVKRLVNADGADIPSGPNAEVFDGTTHTHYNAIAAVTNASAVALATNVLEHHDGEQIRIAINVADEAAWRALTQFKAYVDARLIQNPQSNDPTKTVDVTRINNKPIGIIGSAEVWLKPWALPSYPIAYSPTAPKPLVMREHSHAGMQGLRIAAEIDAHPLYAQYQEAYFGFGVWTRTNGAVLYTAGGAYTDPVL